MVRSHRSLRASKRNVVRLFALLATCGALLLIAPVGHTNIDEKDRLALREQVDRSPQLQFNNIISLTRDLEIAPGFGFTQLSPFITQPQQTAVETTGRSLSLNPPPAGVNAGQNVRIANSSLNVSEFHSLTVEAWINPALRDTRQTLVSRFTTDAQNRRAGYSLNLTLDNKARFFLYAEVNKGVVSSITSQDLILPNEGPFNGWYHIAAVYEVIESLPQGQLRIYVNGVQNPPGVNASSADPASTNTRIGMDQGPTQNFYSGLIDEVRITDGAVYEENFVPHRNMNVLDPVTTGFRTVGLWTFDNINNLEEDKTENSSSVDLVPASAPPISSTNVPPPAAPGPNRAPAVQITGTNPSGFIQEFTPFTIEAIATDPDEGDTVTVQFKKNGVDFGPLLTQRPFSLSVSQGLPASNYTMTALATDNHGAQTTSAEFPLIITQPFNNPPTVSTPVANPPGPFVEPANFVLLVNAFEPDGEALRVQFTLNDVNFGSPIFSPPYNLQVSNLTHGTHTFRAIATDARGLPSTSPPLTITVSQTTNNPPSVNIVSPTNGQVFSRSPININITATASDQGGITQVVIIGDGIPRCTLPGGQSSYSCQWKRVGAGAHTIVVQASDGTLTGSAQANVTVEGRRTPYDFDQDGISDMTIWRPGDLYWYVNTSSPSDFIRKSFGIENDVLVPADYDGDRKTDFAVWRVEVVQGIPQGVWYVENSFTNSVSATVWGSPGDIPVPADYDGDGKANLTVWRQGAFLVRTASGVGNFPLYLGGGEDLPVPADYDGDGKTDAAIWRASDLTWYITASSTGTLIQRNFGIANDYLAPADYDGDGEADVAVWRIQNDDKGIFYVDFSSTTSVPDVVRELGNRGDIPVPGDYDGDGKNDLAVYRPSTGRWQVIRSSSPATITEFFWGIEGDIVPLKYAPLNNPAPPPSSNAKPTVSTSSPAPGQVFPGPIANIPITASASDSDGTITKVEFFGDGNPTPFATDTVGPSYDAVWSSVPEGPHTISVKATDNLNESTTVQVNITVSGTPPSGPPNPPEAPNLSVNQIGRLTSVGNNASGTGSIRIFYGYDELGRSTGTVHVLDGTSYINRTSYGYPQNDATTGLGTVVLSQTFPDSEKVTYSYDLSGAQQSIKTTPFGSSEETIISSVKRNPRGQTVEVSYGNGAISTHAYNESTNLFLNKITTTVGGSTLQDYTYGFDNNGNVNAITDNRDHSLDATYNYDSLDQLTQMKITQSGTSLAYEYNALGNLKKKEGLDQTYGGSQSCPVCPAVRGPHALATAQGVTYNYDANGNMVSTTGGSVTTTITWNAENMPMHIVKGNVVMDKFYLGETLWKKIESGLITYYLPSARVENGRLRKFFGGFAERSPNDTLPGNDGKLKFYHNDHLGSASLVTNESGTVLRKQSYMPYGEDRVVNPGAFNPKYQFNFKEKEASGFYDYGARLYNPATGRWLSADDETDDGLNRYSYVRNNPLTYDDPTGHQAGDRSAAYRHSDPEAANKRAVQDLNDFGEATYNVIYNIVATAANIVMAAPDIANNTPPRDESGRINFIRYPDRQPSNDNVDNIMFVERIALDLSAVRSFWKTFKSFGPGPPNPGARTVYVGYKEDLQAPGLLKLNSPKYSEPIQESFNRVTAKKVKIGTLNVGAKSIVNPLTPGRIFNQEITYYHGQGLQFRGSFLQIRRTFTQEIVNSYLAGSAQRRWEKK